MAVAALIIAIIAALVSMFTFAVGLLLLGGRQDRFVTWGQLSKLVDRVRTVEKGNADLYRYLEAVDEATGGVGHQVLVERARMHSDNTAA